MDKITIIQKKNGQKKEQEMWKLQDAQVSTHATQKRVDIIDTVYLCFQILNRTSLWKIGTNITKNYN